MRIAVVGAGFSGLAVAHGLRAAGIEDFVVLERADAVGGTWRDNTYPGCGCDVPSHLYSFSFAPNPTWSRSFSRQPEILRYLQDVVDRLGVRPHLELGVELESARWEEGPARWRLRTGRGELTADVLVAATGGLTEPALPDVPGLGQFPGPVFHSARWRHDVDLSGKTVAVVGTGASAVQFVPRIQPVVRRLVLFQRTPAWVIPKRDRTISELERRLYHRARSAQRVVRAVQYGVREIGVPGFVHDPRLMVNIERVARRHLEQQVADPHLRALLTPSYRIGCKRILPSNDYYPALTRPNVEVIGRGLGSVEGNRAVATDGTAREVDVVVLGTGFDVSDLPLGHRVHGSQGATLAQVWQRDGRSALRSTTVAGFPNLFIMLGPNSGLGHNSMVYMIESQAAYVVDAVQAMAAGRIAALEPRRSVQRRWAANLQRRMARTVWQTGGCASWYQDRDGSITTLWPRSTLSFRRQLRRIDLTEYEHRRIGPDIAAARAGDRSSPDPAAAPGRETVAADAGAVTGGAP